MRRATVDELLRQVLNDGKKRGTLMADSLGRNGFLVVRSMVTGSMLERDSDVISNESFKLTVCFRDLSNIGELY